MAATATKGNGKKGLKVFAGVSIRKHMFTCLLSRSTRGLCVNTAMKPIEEKKEENLFEMNPYTLISLVSF